MLTLFLKEDQTMGEKANNAQEWSWDQPLKFCGVALGRNPLNAVVGEPE